MSTFIVKLALVGSGDDTVFRRIKYAKDPGRFQSMKRRAISLYLGEEDPHTKISVDVDHYKVTFFYMDAEKDKISIGCDSELFTAAKQFKKKGSLKVFSNVQLKQQDNTTQHAPPVKAPSPTMPSSQVSHLPLYSTTQMMVHGSAPVFLSASRTGGDDGTSPKELHEMYTVFWEQARPPSRATLTTPTQAPAHFIHARHTCNGCFETPIVGARFHAINLPNYDLCFQCRPLYPRPEVQFEVVELERDRPYQEEWRRYRHAKQEHKDSLTTTKQATTTVLGHHICTGCLHICLRATRLGILPDYTLCSQCERQAPPPRPAPAPFIHGRHTCDGCHTHPIVGARFHSANFPDYDLCSQCKHNYKGYWNQFEVEELDCDRPFQEKWKNRLAGRTLKTLSKTSEATKQSDAVVQTAETVAAKAEMAIQTKPAEAKKSVHLKGENCQIHPTDLTNARPIPPRTLDNVKKSPETLSKTLEVTKQSDAVVQTADTAAAKAEMAIQTKGSKNVDADTTARSTWGSAPKTDGKPSGSSWGSKPVGTDTTARSTWGSVPKTDGKPSGSSWGSKPVGTDTTARSTWGSAPKTVGKPSGSSWGSKPVDIDTTARSTDGQKSAHLTPLPDCCPGLTATLSCASSDLETRLDTLIKTLDATKQSDAVVQTTETVVAKAEMTIQTKPPDATLSSCVSSNLEALEMLSKTSAPMEFEVVRHNTETSFASDAAGSGEIATALGETLDRVAQAIDDMHLELDRTPLAEQTENAIAEEADLNDEEWGDELSSILSQPVEDGIDDCSHGSWNLVAGDM